MSLAKLGKPSPKRGIPRTEATRARISAIVRVRTPRGEAHYAFSHGRHQRNLDARRTPEYKDWRNAVFARDRYACQHCGDAKGGNLQSHHIKAFATYPELRYDVANGITLCERCHSRVHSKM